MTNTPEIFLIAIIIIFAVPYAVWRCLRTDHYAPLVVVQIVGGILLGPGVLGAVFPAYYTFVFRPDVIGALNGIAWWAVMLFVFVAGIELDLSQAWQKRGETALTASLALGAPLVCGSAAAMAILHWHDANAGWIGPNGNYWQVVLGIGMACAVTALPILVLFLEKLSVLRRSFGQRVLRYASADDVAIWGVLALILLDWERVERQVGFLVLFVPLAWALRRLMRALPEMDRWYVALIWLAFCGFAADWSGLHFMVGAFLAGVVIDKNWFDASQMDGFRGHILLAIMPVFFLSTGLRTGWGVGGAEVFAAAALLLMASVAGKLAGVRIAGQLLGWEKGEASIIGWLLQTKALIMIIFVNVLLDRGIITAETFTALLLMAVASTMLTIPIVSKKIAQLGGLDKLDAAG